MSDIADYYDLSRLRPEVIKVLRRVNELGVEKFAPRAKAIVLHDAEDLVHPLELGLYDRLVERAALGRTTTAPFVAKQHLRAIVVERGRVPVGKVRVGYGI